MLHQLLSYIKHRFKSIHLHGIHSPFIFQWNRDCLQDRSSHAAYLDIVRFRESVINNPQQLHIKDHGAGSKKLASTARDTTSILRHNCSPISRSKLLYRIATYFECQRVLELGTSLGISTYSLSIAAQEVTSIEASPEVANYARARLETAQTNNAQIIEGTFLRFFC